MFAMIQTHKTENCQTNTGISVVFLFCPFSTQIHVLDRDYLDCFYKIRTVILAIPWRAKSNTPQPPHRWGWESTANKYDQEIWWLLPLEGKFGPGNFALKMAKCSDYKYDDFMVAACIF